MFRLLPKLARSTHWYVDVGETLGIPCWQLAHPSHPLELLKSDMSELEMPRQKLLLMLIEVGVVLACEVETCVERFHLLSVRLR